MVELQKDIKKWEEARCPICLDHPHNAVLLMCSSYDKGCRPFMCNTSSRHSNCLNQFHNSNALTCPLCRGQINGWSVVELAREFMNSKTRSCSTETCNFSGNYMELRMHARSKHPNIKRSDVDLERQRKWARLERESNRFDLRSMLPPINSTQEEETMIYDEIETEESYYNNNNIQGLATHHYNNNVGMMMVDGILCLDSIVECADYLMMLRQIEYFRVNLIGRLPTYYRPWNNNPRVRIPRNNYVNHNLNFRGNNNTWRRRDTGFNNAAPQNNYWRNW